MASQGFPGAFQTGSTTGFLSIGAVQKSVTSAGFPGVFQSGSSTGHLDIGVAQKTSSVSITVTPGVLSLILLAQPCQRSSLSLSLSTNAPSVSGIALVLVSNVSISSSIQAPTISASINTTITTSVLTLTSATFAPSIIGNASVLPSVVNITSSIQAVVIVGNCSVSLSVLSLTSAANAPNVTSGLVVTPSSLSISSATKVPAISGNALLTPNVLNITSVTLSPTASISISLPASLLNITSSAKVVVAGPSSLIVSVSALSISSAVLTTTNNINVPFDITNGLIGWWKLQDGSGTSFTDSSGNGFTGNFVGSPTWTQGIIGGIGVTFNGTTQYGTVNNTSQLIPTDKVSYSFWFNTKQSAAVTADLLRHDQTFTALQLNGGSGSTKAQSVVWPGGTATKVPFNWTYNDGNWHFYVVTYDSTVGTRIFVDNSQVASDNTTGLLKSSGVGALAFMSTEAGGEFCKGSLSDVRLYGRVLSSNEQSSLFNRTGPLNIVSAVYSPTEYQVIITPATLNVTSNTKAVSTSTGNITVSLPLVSISSSISSPTPSSSVSPNPVSITSLAKSVVTSITNVSVAVNVLALTSSTKSPASNTGINLGIGTGIGYLSPIDVSGIEIDATLQQNALNITSTAVPPMIFHGDVTVSVTPVNITSVAPSVVFQPVTVLASSLSLVSSIQSVTTSTDFVATVSVLPIITTAPMTSLAQQSISIGLLAPSVFTGISVSNLNIAANTQAPTIIGNALVTVGSVSISTSLPSITLLIGGGAIVDLNALNLAISTASPSIIGNATAIVSTLNISSLANPVIVEIDESLIQPLLGLTLATVAPTVQASATVLVSVLNVATNTYSTTTSDNGLVTPDVLSITSVACPASINALIDVDVVSISSDILIVTCEVLVVADSLVIPSATQPPDVDFDFEVDVDSLDVLSALGSISESEGVTVLASVLNIVSHIFAPSIHFDFVVTTNLLSILSSTLQAHEGQFVVINANTLNITAFPVQPSFFLGFVRYPVKIEEYLICDYVDGSMKLEPYVNGSVIIEDYVNGEIIIRG